MVWFETWKQSIMLFIQDQIFGMVVFDHWNVLRFKNQ